MEIQAQIIKPFVCTYFYYNCLHLGRERNEVGRVKSVIINPSKPANESFTQFTTTNVGDPYQDPGTFNLRLRDG